MVLAGGSIQHRTFSDLPDYLRAGDVLVLNETRVIAARLAAKRVPTGGRVEILLLHPADSMRYQPAATRWIALLKPARRLRAGERLVVENHEGGGAAGTATILRELPGGARELAFDLEASFEAFLARAGRLPLPPYIHNDSKQAQDRYQTIFARVPGSVAAPTASLHFTPEVLDRLAEAGVEIVRIVLDVGLGTFRPIATSRIDAHAMHAEAYVISVDAAAAIDRARSQGRRIVAAGTTVVRALEGNVRSHGRLTAGEFSTDVFIAPGFEFRIVDALMTNFHLPRSTLLVLVSAFYGRERIVQAYAEAVERRYRFFSFGDAMLILR